MSGSTATGAVGTGPGPWGRTVVDKFGATSSYPFSMNRTNGAPVSTAATVNDVKPPLAGRNVLYVRAVDDAGNPSQPTKYLPRLYPSEATADLLKGTDDLDHSMSGSCRGNPAEDPNGDDGLPRTSRHRPATGRTL